MNHTLDYPQIKQPNWPDFSAQMKWRCALGMIKPIHEPETVKGGVIQQIEELRGQNVD